MEVILLKDLQIGKKGAVKKLPPKRAEYLIRVGSAVAFKEPTPQKPKEKTVRKK